MISDIMLSHPIRRVTLATYVRTWEYACLVSSVYFAYLKNNNFRLSWDNTNCYIFHPNHIYDTLKCSTLRHNITLLNMQLFYLMNNLENLYKTTSSWCSYTNKNFNESVPDFLHPQTHPIRRKVSQTYQTSKVYSIYCILHLSFCIIILLWWFHSLCYHNISHISFRSHSTNIRKNFTSLVDFLL